ELADTPLELAHRGGRVLQRDRGQARVPVWVGGDERREVVVRPRSQPDGMRGIGHGLHARAVEGEDGDLDAGPVHGGQPLAVEDGVISVLGTSLDVPADRVVDARGKYVLPGAIDPHTHMEMPFGGTVTCDDFTSGTVSAAFGGTTSLVDFCMQQRGQTLPDAL